MVPFVFAILILIAGFIASRFIGMEDRKSLKRKEEKIKNVDQDSYDYRSLMQDIKELREDVGNKRKISIVIWVATIVLSAVLMFISVVAIVPTGYTGIKTTFGKVSDDVLGSGINFTLPWQNVINMDNREQRAPFTLEAFSKDIQQVDIQGSINLNIDKTTAMNLYRDVGVEYWNVLVTPRVYEDVKIVIAQYTAEKLVENRQACSDQIYELLKQELSVKGINVISFAIENIDFTDAFESAVEAKQVATQEKQKAQTEQEKMTMEMQQKAERDRIQAQAAADVQKIQADAEAYAVKVQAEAQAEANRKIAETLSDALIRNNTVKQWNGQLPVVTSSEGAANLINLKDMLYE